MNAILPSRISRKSDKADKGKRSPAHRAWVRGHACSACGSQSAIECAHVRTGTDGGTGIKPSDRWCISLCKECHARQHPRPLELQCPGQLHRLLQLRKHVSQTFEKAWGINMKALAEAFFKASPHRFKLEELR